MDLDPLIDFFQTLSPERIKHFPDFYSREAYFKDPFNEVRGVAAIQAIFTHMFTQVEAPHFLVTERLIGADSAILIWEFHYTICRWGKRRTHCIRGASHLKYDAAGKIHYHRDYWDAAEELYMKLPLLGCLMRALQRRLASSPPH